MQYNESIVTNWNTVLIYLANLVFVCLLCSTNNTLIQILDTVYSMCELKAPEQLLLYKRTKLIFCQATASTFLIECLGGIYKQIKLYYSFAEA